MSGSGDVRVIVDLVVAVGLSLVLRQARVARRRRSGEATTEGRASSRRYASLALAILSIASAIQREVVVAVLMGFGAMLSLALSVPRGGERQ